MRTTSSGYADRFERFREAMEAVNPSIEVSGYRNRLTDYNEPLFERADDLTWFTDRVLLECHADSMTSTPTTPPSYRSTGTRALTTLRSPSRVTTCLRIVWG